MAQAQARTRGARLYLSPDFSGIDALADALRDGARVHVFYSDGTVANLPRGAQPEVFSRSANRWWRVTVTGDRVTSAMRRQRRVRLGGTGRTHAYSTVETQGAADLRTARGISNDNAPRGLRSETTPLGTMRPDWSRTDARQVVMRPGISAQAAREAFEARCISRETREQHAARIVAAGTRPNEWADPVTEARAAEARQARVMAAALQAQGFAARDARQEAERQARRAAWLRDHPEDAE